jgi:crotonobetainyl-CoA:carnitine CoA-transferase CaiB-like acyl-CoA transferase
VTGFGQDGPYAHRSGYDFVAQAMAGLMEVTGEADGKPGGGPQRVGVPVADMFTGFAATVSILAALRHRDQTGEGQYCEVSLYETMVSLMQAPMASWLNAGKLMQRTGNDAVVAVPYGVFQGADSKFVIGVLNDREFIRLAAALGHAEWAEDERFRRARDRAANRDLLLGMMSDVLRQKPRAEWLAILEDAKITSGPINTAADVEADPHTKARGLIVEVPHHAGGRVRVPASPLHLTATPVTYRYGIPAPGEHTDAVLREFADMTAEEIAAARAAGVL